MIPIIVIWGHRKSLNPMGWTAQKCSRCKKIQAFQCYDQVQSNHVYYMYGKEKSVCQVLTCSFCDTGFGVDPKIQGALKIDSTWKRMDGPGRTRLVRNGKVAVSDQLRGTLRPFEVCECSNPYKLETGEAS
jgi:hypothetical protein